MIKWDKRVMEYLSERSSEGDAGGGDGGGQVVSDSKSIWEKGRCIRIEAGEMMGRLPMLSLV